MNGIIRFALSVVITAIALYITTAFVPGVSITPADSQAAFLWVAVVFIAVNATLGPILRVVSIPLTIITLGLFSLVVNALLFLAVEWLSDFFGLGLSIDSFGAAVIGAVVMGLATWLMEKVLAAMGLSR